MAIKENIDYIKDELNTQEQFLENMIKGERFIKKYKFIIIAFLLIAIVGGIIYYVNDSINESKIAKSNEIYNHLITNPNDTKSIDELQKLSPSLFALYKFRQFQDANDTKSVENLTNLNIDPILKQIFSAYTQKGNSEILADYNALLKGYEFLKQNKFAEAKAQFAKIPQDSQLINIVKNLQHFQGHK
ncbi:MAG: hypothetical protein K5978_01965 [Campylobacter sp.]|nr:hypothetical protein [Campylobacter sp.]